MALQNIPRKRIRRPPETPLVDINADPPVHQLKRRKVLAKADR